MMSFDKQKLLLNAEESVLGCLKSDFSGFCMRCPDGVMNRLDTVHEASSLAVSAAIGKLHDILHSHAEKTAEELQSRRALTEADMECAWLDWEHSVFQAAKHLAESALDKATDGKEAALIQESYQKLEESIAEHMETLYCAVQQYEAALFGEDEPVGPEAAEKVGDKADEDVLGNAVKQIGDAISGIGKAVEAHAKSPDVAEKAGCIRKFVGDAANRAGDVLVTGVAMAADGVEKLGKKVGGLFTVQNAEPADDGAQDSAAEASAEPGGETSAPENGGDAARQVCDTIKETAAELRESLKNATEEAGKTAGEAAESLGKLKNQAASVLADGVRAAAAVAGKIADEIDSAVDKGNQKP